MCKMRITVACALKLDAETTGILIEKSISQHLYMSCLCWGGGGGGGGGGGADLNIGGAAQVPPVQTRQVSLFRGSLHLFNPYSLIPSFASKSPPIIIMWVHIIAI